MTSLLFIDHFIGHIWLKAHIGITHKEKKFKRFRVENDAMD